VHASKAEPALGARTGRLEAFFLPAADGSGQRLCVLYAPAAVPVRAAVLYIHPWCEEMNKSRRMAAMQARALAAAGCAVLQIDLHGCGDSSGDFSEAHWNGWVEDVLLAARWLQQRHSVALWLWGLRAGCLLAVQAASRLTVPCQFLFWQPAPSGKTLLQQFLRLKAAADLQQGEAKGAVEQARRELAAGDAVDVAGYRLAPGLAAGLEQAVLDPPPPPQGPRPRAGHVIWIELSLREGATLLPASASKADAWRAAGYAVHSQVVPGPAFWQTQEIEDAPALIEATRSAVSATTALLSP
jgi:exosortase A-associated hydrolase 2